MIIGLCQRFVDLLHIRQRLPCQYGQRIRHISRRAHSIHGAGHACSVNAASILAGSVTGAWQEKFRQT